MTEVIIITLLHCLIVTFIHSSYFQLLIHKSNLQSCLCQYVKDLCENTLTHCVGFRIGCAFPISLRGE